MEASFWHQRWEDEQIAFHEKRGNHLLTQYFKRLSSSGVATRASATPTRVFLPLCGKTLDIGWLLAQGCQVAGAELSELAIRQLFDELGVTPQVSKAGQLMHFQAPDIDMFVGDIFDLSREALRPVDAIYDRAALVALPDEMRLRYARHLTHITANAPQLLICFEYEQSQMEGPPFSIDAAQVALQYKDQYAIEFLGAREVPGGLKGRVAANESAWLLRPQSEI
ncbi:MAG: thiopurine S-methyltransferase [Burkholderiaceae bacterium]